MFLAWLNETDGIDACSAALECAAWSMPRAMTIRAR
jgi:hypothetical protein